MENLDFNTLIEAAQYLDCAGDREVLENMKAVYESGEYFVAFVGQFSAGKSYLINNIIGRAILPQGTMETTPLLTYIRYGKQEKAIVVSTNGNKQEINIEEVADIIQKGNESAWNIKDLEHIEIFVDSDILKSGLILLDTPGVNTLIERHEQLLAQSLILASRIVYVTGNAPSKVDIEKLSYMQEHGFNLAFVRTHCDLVNTAEESINELISNDVHILQQEKICTGAIFHVSNIPGTSRYDNIASIQDVLKNLGSDVEKCRSKDFADQLAFFKQKYSKRLAEAVLDLQLKQRNALDEINRKKQDAENRLNGLKQKCDTERSKLQEEVTADVRRLKKSYHNAVEGYVDTAAAEISEARDIDNVNEMKALLSRLQHQTAAQAINYLNSNVTPLLADINKNEVFTTPDMENLEVPEIDNMDELAAYRNDELVNLKNNLLNICDAKETLAYNIQQAENSPEYLELVNSLKELNKQLQEIRAEDSALGEYIPEMIQVMPEGMQPSDVGKFVGNIADWAMILLPSGVLTKSGKVTKYMGKLVGVAEKASKIIQKGKGAADILNKLRNMGKVYATKRRIEKAAKIIEAGRNITNQIRQNDTTGMLDYITLEYWGQKLGSCFDAPPRLEENLEYRNIYMRQKEELRKNMLAVQQKAYEEKCQLGLFRNEQAKQKAYMESLCVDEKRLEEQIAGKEAAIKKEARNAALKKWRENTRILFEKSMLATLPDLIEDYLDSVTDMVELYVNKKLESKMLLISKEQNKLEEILLLSPEEVAVKLKTALELKSRLDNNNETEMC